MRLTYTLTVEVTKTEGKFVSKDVLSEQVEEEILAADPGVFAVDESEYEVTGWEVVRASK